MPQLEPTYLRYIYDGLVKGSIHPENAAELPEGLIGLYEEAFDERTSVVERQKLLRRFAIWALLKKEVSAGFVAEVLGETEDEIQVFISTYSAWFNSPESGKFQLYHERLKVFLLQKLSDGEVGYLNETIVDFLKIKVKNEILSESVEYCYEHISFHLFLNAYLVGKDISLSTFCLDNNFKNRQFEISGYYDWEERLLAFGVEYFSIKKDPICHNIVFEKTKIQHKKKDIDLILSLIRNREMGTVYRFFQNTNEINLYARIEIAYFYLLSFFEIFEKEEWNFVTKKETATKLLEIFEDNFQWDSGYYLSQFVDVNISFRIHCYFEQFGLNYKLIAILSSDHKVDFFDFEMDMPLKFIGSKHRDEVNFILKDFKKYNYGLKGANYEGLIVSDTEDRYNENIGDTLKQKIKSLSKTQLIRDELAYSIELINSFDELCAFIKNTLKKIDITREIKLNVLNEYENVIKVNSLGLFSIKGIIENRDGKNTLEFMNNDSEMIINEISLLPELIANGLSINEFMNMELKKRYSLLLDENLNSEDDIELLLFFVDLSEYYQKEKPKDLINLLSALLMDFHLNMNEELIDNYIDELIDIINSSIGARIEFESDFFIQVLEFFNRNDVNGHRKKTLEMIQVTLLENYFEFSYYHYSFIAGCELINLFTAYKIEFPEKEIVDRIIEDLNYLIEEKDYIEVLEIENCSIDNIYQKSYFWDFYNTVKRIYIEELSINLSRYIFEDILEKKGVSYKTVLFFKENSNQFPGMYAWAIKRLSIRLSDTNTFLSYLPIIDQNEILLERLLMNIVSNRKQLKVALNIQILKYYGLDWVLELDNEYEKLMTSSK